jgi:hypothetical protein
MTKNDLQLALEKCYWRYARTLGRIPHHYTLRKTWKSDEFFDQAVITLRENSVDEMFGRKTFKYCYLGNFKYWTMGSPVERTILINKVQINLGKG